MYKPWKPIERVLSAHPCIDWCVYGRSVILNWTEWRNNECLFEMELKFEEGIAGIFCFDESTYQTAGNFGIPSDNEIDACGSSPIPWPAWRSALNYRKHLYGDLGKVSYTDVYTYYFVASDTVLLLDVADAEASIDVKKS